MTEIENAVAKLAQYVREAWYGTIERIMADAGYKEGDPGWSLRECSKDLMPEEAIQWVWIIHNDAAVGAVVMVWEDMKVVVKGGLVK